MPSVRAFATPLGEVAIDAEAVARASALPQVVDDAAHAQEHSLEVQLPFLQATLANFTLVPFVVGAASTADVAAVLDLLWGGPETLIVVSSDLSHYHRYDEARAIDRGTAETILALRPGIDHEQACVLTPVNGLLAVARRRGLVPHLLDLRNSGDTAGDRSRVVGCGPPRSRRRRHSAGAAMLAASSASLHVDRRRVSARRPRPGRRRASGAFALPGATSSR